MTAPSGARRRVALAGHTGDEPTARAGLADADPGVRSTALGALARLGRLDDGALSVAGDDPVAAVRRRAAQLAAEAPGVSLLALLGDSDPMVAEMAAWACGERADIDAPTFRVLLGLASGHDDALVREAAVAALGALGDDAALPVVLAATGDRPAVRRRAVIALAAFEGEAVEQAWRDALGDRDWQVRQAAEELLQISADAGAVDTGAPQDDQPSS